MRVATTVQTNVTLITITGGCSSREQFLVQISIVGPQDRRATRAEVDENGTTTMDRTMRVRQDVLKRHEVSRMP
jgi:sulfatase maturation enzyme AslB (radical SAM superfamily)